MSNQPQIREATFLWKQYGRYENHLREKGITTPIEYLDHYGELGGMNSNERDSIEALGTPLDALYSLHPFLDQDIMYVDLNPGTKRDIRASFGGTNEYTRKAAAMQGKSGEERLVELMWHMGSHYGIGDQPGREYAVKGIYNHFSASSQPFNSYLTYKNRNVAESAFEDIYFSRMYKWPTSGASQLEGEDRRFGQKEFLRELDVLDPHLLVVACKDAWNGLRNKFSDQIEIRNAGSSTGKITGKYGSTTESDIGGIYKIDKMAVVTLPHPGP